MTNPTPAEPVEEEGGPNNPAGPVCVDASAPPKEEMTAMITLNVAIGARIRILSSRNPDRIGKLATIIGERRAGRSVVTGLPNYVHPIELDGGVRSVNGKPIAVEDGTFEVINGGAAPVNDRMSAAYALKLLSTGEADGPVGADGMVRLDDE